MTPTLNGLLIDPEARTITPVTLPAGDYKAIYPLIGAETFDLVRLDDQGDGIYIDDEGLLHDRPKHFFTIDAGKPIAGKGLVLGSDDEGESIDPRITLDQLTARVGWPEVTHTGFTDISGTIDHPVFGKTEVIGHEATFAPKMTEDEQVGEVLARSYILNQAFPDRRPITVAAFALSTEIQQRINNGERAKDSAEVTAWTRERAAALLKIEAARVGPADQG